ncbi:MAG TPA: hypothetical protein VGM88_00380 [Kofleriaceae bacterium]|jgi:hypothetical protein
MALNDRGYRNGAFCLELEGKIAGYVKKIDLGKLKGEVATVNLGPVVTQKRYVTKMSWDVMKFDIGLGMGKEVYDWINAAFNQNYQRKNGAFIMFDHNYNAQRRCDFTDAHITEITIPACDPKGKEAIHFSVTLQPETVRFSDGGGGKSTAVVGENQKLHANTNFRMDAAGLPSKNIIKVDSVKWNCKVTEDAVGEFIESQYLPVSCEIGPVKITVGSQDYKPWYNKAYDFLVVGNRPENQELTLAIDIFGPDAKTRVANLQFLNCGVQEFGFEPMEANGDKVSQFTATWYTEQVKLIIDKFN